MDAEARIHQLEREKAAASAEIASLKRKVDEDRALRMTSNGANVLVQNSPSPSTSLL